MSANDVQHGGTHYKKHKIQVWDFILANNIGYMEGSAIKYLCRWQDKGGVQDLKKAVHFIERLIEEQEQQEKTSMPGEWIKVTNEANKFFPRIDLSGPVYRHGVPPRY